MFDVVKVNTNLSMEEGKIRGLVFYQVNVDIGMKQELEKLQKRTEGMLNSLFALKRWKIELQHSNKMDIIDKDELQGKSPYSMFYCNLKITEI